MDDQRRVEPHSTGFKISDELDLSSLRERFHHSERLRIPDVLRPRDALRLYKHLANDVEWNTFLVAGDSVYSAHPSAKGSSELSPAEQEMHAEASTAAAHGFACLHDADRLFPEDIPEGEWSGNPQRTALLAQFADFVSSEEFLSLARSVTGLSEIARADIQATRHRAGHFTAYHAHRPYSSDRGIRLAGFELNLTLEWRPDWGGLRSFRLAQDATAEAYFPSFNLLDLFNPRKGRWISRISPSADQDRLALSGWLYGPQVESAHAN